MDFSERVFEAVKKIPRGRVSTYSDVAGALNTRAFRAVGQALKRNKDPRVPCHRVIKSSGELGGFRGTKTDKKAALLKREGIQVRGNKIDLKRYLHGFSD